MRRIVLAACIALVAAHRSHAGDVDPALGETSERTDPGKTVALSLPTNWKAGGRGQVFGSLETWAGTFDQQPWERPHASIDVRLASSWSRAELAWWGSVHPWPGERKDGSLRRGDGWVEEVRNDPERHETSLYRVVEQGGRAYVLVAETHEKRFPKIEDKLRAVFDTFRAVASPPLFTPPAGYAASMQGGARVVTDTKDVKMLQRVLADHAAAWKVMTQLLPGARAIADPPVVVVCDADQAYSDITLPTAERYAVGCDMIPHLRIVIARVSAKEAGFFDFSLRRFTGLQYSQYFFGGRAPDWVESGLAAFPVAAIARGKPDKPPPDVLNAAKSAAAKLGGSLDTLIATRRVLLHDAPAEEFDMAAYAWHCFFRYGPGAKTYGARYQRYLDDLRRTGAPDEALKAWDDVDKEALGSEFLAWIAAWKP